MSSKVGKTAIAKWDFDSKSLKANFCQYCGTILELPEDLSQPVICSYCKYSCTIDELEAQEIVTHHRTEASEASQELTKKARDRQKKSGEGKGAMVDVDCEKCGHKRAYFRTAQLRSADEGQTVFYECMKCGYKWAENT